jgi:hypothetical protein
MNAESIKTALLDAMEELNDALDDAMGIIIDVNSPEGFSTISYKAKDNTRIKELYKTPMGKEAVDMFLSKTPNPKKLRREFGI